MSLFEMFLVSGGMLAYVSELFVNRCRLAGHLGQVYILTE